MKTYSVEITAEKLCRLRMLGDWQLKAEGFDPASITQACAELEQDREKACREVENEWMDYMKKTFGATYHPCRLSHPATCPGCTANTAKHGKPIK